MVISRKYKVIFFWIFLVLVFILTLKNDLISNYNTKSVNVHRDYEVNSHNLTALEGNVFYNDFCFICNKELRKNVNNV